MVEFPPETPFLYGITDERFLNPFNIVEAVERAILGGAKVIQYRAKRKSAREMYEEALLVREATRNHDAVFIVNDRLDLALAVEADGVHLGQSDLPFELVKGIAGEEFIVGLSTHNLEQVREANEKKEFLDYIGFGPVFPTTTKENPDPVTGVELLCRAVELSELPVVAIGGINPSNLEDVCRCKPAGVAVVRALFEKGDPFVNAREIKERLSGC
ncbi:thiamine phosphate synthase [Thermovibrio ammonificans]|uniref:Thiamine-phosphate synthase n=1 Tax=Thermovibrio ammonificans (strain DSM 15698 / JCM 12110 / HB-1) TaxID=648996 RepID=E8T5Y1_THEA1|nr:thiamine phosphate synthase [Thermovibrio ammonificans]ADU96565.1 thiamine-phosphate pyrophosphorylase [Thermovibrio ammonificans HB-1]